MAKTSKPRVVRSSRAPRDRLSAGEWPVLRACWRLGPEAPTTEIVRELQKDTLIDYRHAQTVLRRLVEKGYLEVEKQGPRRNVYTTALPEDEILADAMRVFVNEVVGLEPENVKMLRQVLDELETRGPYAVFDPESLPRDLRLSLITLVDGFIERKRDRWALAVALGLKHQALDRVPTMAGAISLLLAAGGDTITAALKLLDAMEQLLEEEEADKAEEIARIRKKLRALSTS